MNEKKDNVKATSDIFIKYMFGMDTKESNHLVLSFINSVLQDSDFPAITKIIQKNPFNSAILILNFILVNTVYRVF